MGTSGERGGNILDEIMDACHAQKNRTTKIMEELARLADERDGMISQTALEELADMSPFALMKALQVQEGPAQAVEVPSAPAPPKTDSSPEASRPPAKGTVDPEEALVIQSFLTAAQMRAERRGDSSGTIMMPMAQEMDEDEPSPPATPHERLAQAVVDPRALRALLLSVKSFPALYRAIQCHHVITGKASKPKSKSGKKKRKEKEKEKESSDSDSHGKKDRTSTPGASAPAAPTASLLASGNLEPLNPRALNDHLAVFTSKAIGDRSLQSILITIKVLLTTYLTGLEVKEPAGSGPSASGCGDESVAAATHVEKLPVGSMLALLFLDSFNPFEAARQAVIRSQTPSAASSQGLASATETTPKPQEEEIASAPSGGGSQSMEEDADEARLLQEALALSIASSLGGTAPASDQQEKEGEKATSMEVDPKPGGEGLQAKEEGPKEEKAKYPERPPTSYEESASAESMRGLPFFQGQKEEVPVDTVVLALLSYLDELCTTYVQQVTEATQAGTMSANDTAEGKGPVAPPEAIQAHPLTFMLLHSLLNDLLAFYSEEVRKSSWSTLADYLPSEAAQSYPNDPAMEDFEITAAVSPPLSKKLRLPPTSDDGSKVRMHLFTSCAILSTLRILDANLLYVAQTNQGAAVGLGQVSAPTASVAGSKKKGGIGSSTLSGEKSEGGKKSGPLFVSRLRATVEQFMELDPDSSRSETEAWSIAQGSGPIALSAASIYTRRIRDAALSVWVTGVKYFYPHHSQRYRILLDLLLSKTKVEQRFGGVARGQREARRDKLLQKLCLRMAMPDLAQQFFADLVVPLPDPKARPPPETMETTPEMATGPPDEEEGGTDIGLSFLLVSDETEAALSAASHGSERLPLIFDVLLDQLQDPQVLKGREPGTQDTVIAKLVLLHALQKRLVDVLAATSARDKESQQLELDSKRCSEHIVVGNNGRTATQRGSKSWGSVMATTGFAPSTGVHQWTVRLDRCEKGHVFIGVCTGEASTRTYVGGDRFGWGMIGTRALWHNRSKLRGDYGEGYGSRCLVRVKLDTDNGTLSLGMGSADWGLAFEKLPRNEVLYPAIGLYQRDDQVTILPITADPRSHRGPSDERISLAMKSTLLEAIKPLVRYSERLLRCANQILDGVEAADQSEDRNLCANHPLIRHVLLSLGAALCRLPSLPVGFGMLALRLIPPLTALVKRIDKLISRGSRSVEPHQPATQGGLFSSIDGSWVIRSAAAESIPAQEYTLDLRTSPLANEVDDPNTNTPSPSQWCRKIEGHGEGGMSKVSVEGAILGSRIRFLESWHQGGTCLVEGRLSLDGTGFTGTFRDTRSTTSATITGRRKKAGSHEGHLAVPSLGRLEVVLALLAGKLGCVVLFGLDEDVRTVDEEGAAGGEEKILMEEKAEEDLQETKMEEDSSGAAMMEQEKTDKLEAAEDTNRSKVLLKWRCSRLFSAGLPVRETLEQLQANLESYVDMGCDIESWWKAAVLQMPKPNEGDAEGLGVLPPFYDDLISGKGVALEVDRWVQRHVGESPFTRVGGEPMKVARRVVLAALIRHSGAFPRILPEWDSKGTQNIRPGELLIQLWKAGQRVVNWAVRNKQTSGLSFTAMADIISQKARFLMTVLPSTAAQSVALNLSTSWDEVLPSPGGSAKALQSSPNEEQSVELLLEVVRFFESKLRDLDSLRRELVRASILAFHRGAALKSMYLLLGALQDLKPHGAGTEGGHPPKGLDGMERALTLAPAVSACLQHFAPALLGHVDPFSCDDGIGTPAVYASPTNDTNGDSRFPPGYYLDNLEGCGLFYRLRVRSSFESLYQLFVQLLQRSVYAADLDTTLVLLHTWDVVIQPEDHGFLARVGIFRTLQMVLDGVRPSPEEFFFSGMPPQQHAQSTACGEKMIAQARNRVVSAALKVVHLLATQVAYSTESQDSEVSLPTITVSDLTLERQPSGPDTLSKSLFDMLHAELLCALRHVAENANAPAKPGNLMRESSTAGVDADEEAEDESDLSSGLYCYRIIGLLHSVSSSNACKRYLTSAKWLKLLLAGIQAGNASLQRRIFRLLRLLLPSVNPMDCNIKIIRSAPGDRSQLFSEEQFGEESFASLVRSKKERQESDLVEFILHAVASVLPVQLYRDSQEASPPSSSSSTGCFSFSTEESQLSAEAVALLRCLMEVPSWSTTLNKALIVGLQLLPDVLLQDAEAIASQWEDSRPKLCRAISALSVLGGYVEDLRVGGMVSLRPFSLFGVSETLALRLAAMSHTCGLLTSYDQEKKTAEVVLVEKEGAGVSWMAGGLNWKTPQQQQQLTSTPYTALRKSTSQSGAQPGYKGLSLAGGLPVRAVKLNAEDLVAVSEVDPYFPGVSDEAVSALFSALIDQAVAWLDANVPLPKKDAAEHLEVAEARSLEEEDEKGGEEEPASTQSSTAEVPKEDPLSPRSRKAAAVVANVKTIQSAVVLQTFRAASESLACPGFSTAFLGRPGCQEAFRRLLRVAVGHTHTGTCGLSGVGALQESFVQLWSSWRESFVRKPGPAPSTVTKRDSGGHGGGGGGGDGGNGKGISADSVSGAMSSMAQATAAIIQELQNAASASSAENSADHAAALATMMEMGFPKEWCAVALRRCGHNIEVAVNFCFEHGAEMEQILAEEQAISAATAAVAGRSGGRSSDSMRRTIEGRLLMKQLLEMGFPPSWCAKALAVNSNNVNAALTWILSNGEALAAEDENGEDVQETAEIPSQATDADMDYGPNPLRVVSGGAEIRPDLSVEGVPRGGFASVGCRGCLVTSGKWYYEVLLRTAGCMQIGWCDAAFRGDAQGGDGVGDGPHSWAYDGWRQFKWHDGQAEWGARWKAGDVVGCALDMDEKVMHFFLNGLGAELGMGEAFRNIRFSGGLYPCVSFNRREKLQINFGSTPFRFPAPEGYRPYIELVHGAISQHAVIRERYQLEGLQHYVTGGEVKAGAVFGGVPPVDEDEGASPDDVEARSDAGVAVVKTAREVMYVEDCFEEEMGTESLHWQNRYFSADSSGRVTGASSNSKTRRSTKVESSKPDSGGGESVQERIIMLAADLCVLYARRALLTLLAMWPSSSGQGQSTDLCTLLTTTNADGSNNLTDLVHLLKLVSVVGPATQVHLSKMSLVSNDLVFPNNLESALQAGGAPSLYAITPAMSEAIKAAYELNNKTMLEELSRSLFHQIFLALDRENLMTPGLVTGQQDGEEVTTDDGVVNRPNLCLAVWMTGMLVANRSSQEGGAMKEVEQDIVLRLCEAWTMGLKSPSVAIKQVAASMVSAMLQEAARPAALEGGQAKTHLKKLLGFLDASRTISLGLHRLWIERSTFPIGSRYCQALAELSSSLRIAKELVDEDPWLNHEDIMAAIKVDASMPAPLPPKDKNVTQVCPTSSPPYREWEEGMVACDDGWEQWTGTVMQHTVKWKKPDKVPLRTAVDGGEGPPSLVEGGNVTRGPHWCYDDADGGENSLGKVEAIIDWEGKPGMGRRVVWANGNTGNYRWGAYGNFDLTHVELSRDGKEVVKKHLPPETAEAVAARKGFGDAVQMGVILWIRPVEKHGQTSSSDDMAVDGGEQAPIPFDGVCEWPQYHASSYVQGERYSDGSMTFTEKRLLSGTPDAGWVPRFGSPGWRAGVTYKLGPTYDRNDNDDGRPRLLGDYFFKVELGGEQVEVAGDMRLQQTSLFAFDQHCRSESIGISEDGRSAFSLSSEGKSLVFGTVGFSRGVHYWEIKIEQEEIGSIYLGVAEKPDMQGGAGATLGLRLNRWQGWGFINYRASFCWNPQEGASNPLGLQSPPERPYGDNFHFGDIVGVKLDMEKGVLSFFLDGMKYGDHILSDLGVAFDNLLGKPRVKPRVLYPVVGFRKKGDRVTLTGRWLSTPGVHPKEVLEDVTSVGSLLFSWRLNAFSSEKPGAQPMVVAEDEDEDADAGRRPAPLNDPPVSPRVDWLPQWLYYEGWVDWRRWRTGRWKRIITRAQSSALIDVDTSIDACVHASLLLGLKHPLFAGDRIKMSRRCGRVLEQPESRVVLGAYRGLLWYQVDLQREGGVVDGANLACCWLPCDVEGIQLVAHTKRLPSAVDEVPLEVLSPFRGGKLRVVYDQAVVREGLEIDTSEKVGDVEHGAILIAEQRRINSSNIARYQIRHGRMQGWISERIRGESEDIIVVRVRDDAKPTTPPSDLAEDDSMVADQADTTDGATPGSRPTDPMVDEDEISLEDLSEQQVLMAVQRWKAQVQQRLESAMVTDEAEVRDWASLDVSSLWCLDGAADRPSPAEAEACTSFEKFKELSGLMREGDPESRWSVEADMQLVELISAIAQSQGETPLNMSFSNLQTLLATGLQETGEEASFSRSLLIERPALLATPAERLLARASLLRVFNNRLSRALPFISLSLPEAEWEREQVGYSEPISMVPTHSLDSSSGQAAISPLFTVANKTLWKPTCTARRLRRLRRLVFTHTKRAFWESVLAATTTPTQLHQDEYEDPREIKTIKINRVRASASRLASIRNINERLRLSVFGQLHKEMRSWPNSSFRRAYLGKGHGGQRRAFKVKFLGEGVNDYGGPYRAVFEQIVDELQDDRLPLSQRAGEKCLLPLLVPCPNRLAAVGSNQDKFVLNPGQSSPLALELMQFLGKITGMALRHGLPMGLDLPATVWKPLVGQSLRRADLESFDLLAIRTLEQVERAARGVVEAASGEQAGDTLIPEGWGGEDLNFTTHLSDGTVVNLCRMAPSTAGDPMAEAADIKVTRSNWQEYVSAVETARLKESSAMLRAFQDGVSAVLPLELFPLFTDEEFEKLMCGVREVDVDLLRQCTDYEDVDSAASHVQYFWEVLKEMRPEERTEFLRFTWARSRMPSSAKDFPMNFKIQGPQGGAKDSPDIYLPHAQTCFFSLSLPPYSSKDVLRKKLLFAIKNSPNMDADVRLHNAEGWGEA